MENMRKWTSFGLLLGRICLASIFLLGGIDKFIDSAGNASYMASRGFTMIPFFLYLAALIEIVGGLSLFFGYKARYGALLLILFLIPTSVIFHDFWNYEGTAWESLITEFIKNIGIMGGLIYVLSIGPGRFSVDRG